MNLLVKRLFNISHIPDFSTFLSQNSHAGIQPVPSGSLSGLKYYIQTYGCQMNENDSEIVASILSKAGLESTASVETVPNI